MQNRRFDTFQSVLTYVDQLGWHGDSEIVSALYASAGGDTRAIVFLHPEFLRARKAIDVPAPNLFIFVDRDSQADPSFNDGYTDLTTETLERIVIAGLPGWLRKIRYTPGPEDTHGYAARIVALIGIEASNEIVSAAMAREDWVPDVLIGVCDGCSFGGNKSCVNELSRRGLDAATAARIRVPRWWITDHFKGAEWSGDFVISADPSFPFRFRRVVLLTTDWGRYNWRKRPGTMVYEVLRA